MTNCQQRVDSILPARLDHSLLTGCSCGDLFENMTVLRDNATGHVKCVENRRLELNAMAYTWPWAHEPSVNLICTWKAADEINSWS